MDLIDCINYKRRQLEEQKVKDEILKQELVAKIKDYFRKLDSGDYKIRYSDLFDDVVRKRDEIYINVYDYSEKKKIFKKKKTYKTVGIFYWDRHVWNISDWPLTKVEIFHHNLGNILQKIGEQYGCNSGQQ